VRNIAITLVMIAGTSAAAADCVCSFRGGEVKEGETACIDSAKGKTMARCGKFQNVTTWIILEEPCKRDVSIVSDKPDSDALNKTSVYEMTGRTEAPNQPIW
jgi:hypothetical protein